VEIKVPTIGESITEGTIAQWLKKDGAHVHQGESLFELETEKATTEVPSPAEGSLRITVPEGKTVAVGAVIGNIDESKSQPAPAASKEQRMSAEQKSQPPSLPPPDAWPLNSTSNPATFPAADGAGASRKRTSITISINGSSRSRFPLKVLPPQTRPLPLFPPIGKPASP